MSSQVIAAVATVLQAAGIPSFNQDKDSCTSRPSKPQASAVKSQNSKSTNTEEKHEKEDRGIPDAIADYKAITRPLSPHSIAQDTRKKNLGKASPGLQVKDFELIKTLGTGTFARVWLSRLAKPGHEYGENVFALKVLRKADIVRLKQVEHVQNERTTLGVAAGHPFITTLITTFRDDDRLYMLLDYCPGGEVFTHLRRTRRFGESTARFYAAEIVLVLEFLHEVEGIAYRDLKPENLLLDAQGHIKLVDFGFAKNLREKETYTLCGTPEYLAPEVIKNTGHGKPVDWWALGILIYEFLAGQPPFWDSNPINIYRKIVDGHIHWPTRHPISAPAQAIINAFLTARPSQRLGNDGNGAKDVKEHEFFKGLEWDTLYYRKVNGPFIPEVKDVDDASNFDEYPDEEVGKITQYTEEMREKWDNAFEDF